ncbi:MAG: glycoside hydrolase family 97 protein [Prevotella sp.]|nr:glycoside hydrolase family 97 protein [Prevotella sp.]
MRIISVLVLFCASLWASAGEVKSPNGKLSLTEQGAGWAVSYNGQTVMELPAIGFESTGVSGKLRFLREVKDDYQMIAGKRLHCTNEANEYAAPVGQEGRVVVRLYNDGIAFRYEAAPGKSGKTRISGISGELTTFRIPEGTHRWMQQWCDGYEGFFPLSTTAKQKAIPSFSGQYKDVEGNNVRWGYPALIEVAPTHSEGGQSVFALISEANIEKGQSASCLYNDGELFRVVQDKKEPATEAMAGHGHTSWRVVIVGTLKDVVESTLVTDVSEPSKIDDTSWIHPGVVSWVYWAYNHGSNDYSIIKKYTDMAATLKLPYVLIDAEWDQMDQLTSNEGKTIEDAVSYALSKGVKPMIWYNSSVGWVDGAPTPKFRLNKPEDREKEFTWCEKIGVAGVKIDFFSGDTQLNMDFCQDLLECAARHHLLVNFHGATIPRGWQRTWPNLLSTEGVYGAEWYNNVPTFTDKAACHNATLPFTRNVIGPMDYTPCAFSDSQHPHITTRAHELALTVLFESGLQHLADRPESFLSQPQEVQQFLGQLPAAWDETRFIDGYPGEYVVLARRSGNTWYVAGINGTDEAKTINLQALALQTSRSKLFADDKEGNWSIISVKDLPSSIKCLPRGGFVIVGNK